MSRDETSSYAGAEALGEMAEGVGRRRGAVSFHIEVDGLAGPLEVRDVQIQESLNEVGTCQVIFMSTERVASSELLRKECRLTVERADQVRSFGGIVQHASVRGVPDGTQFTVRIVPALWYLSQIVTSRVHQNTTVPDLVIGLVDELLGAQRRSVRDDSTATYQEHEYLVQYEESYLDFVSRLCEQEGLFWYFDHSEEPEVMVLVDAQSPLQAARDGDSDEVPYIALQAENEEGVHTVDYDRWVGPTDAVISGFDWTRPWVSMGDARTGRSDREPALEVYDHTDALTYHGYQEPAYSQDTASIQVQMRAERFDLGRQDWSMGSTFIGARPGHVFELVRCPEEDLNRRYMIVSASSGGVANGRDTGTYGSSLKCVPTSMPYRPQRRVPRPIIPGLETATVVTDGREIQTDVHGRVRVQFHWDRLGENDEHSSCWLRVVQNWAGEGFGTFFLPRRGMEVVVGFLGGNPDRPIITGCVYNGANPVPAELDAKRTQSVIRTKSSPDSEGFNEIRFEDEAGNEFISIHAEKDFNELVEHNHSTHVKNCQTNTVDVDQTQTIKRDQRETIERDQSMKVERNRTKVVLGDETTEIGPDSGNRTEKVHNDEKVEILGERVHEVTRDDTLMVKTGTRSVTVLLEDHKTEVLLGKHETECLGRFFVQQAFTEKLLMESRGEWSSQSRINLLATDAATIELNADGSITVDADREITLRASSGNATIVLNSEGVQITGAKVSIDSQSDVDIDAAGMVNIKR